MTRPISDRQIEAKTRAVTEFDVTYFGLADLEHDALLDLYADHAYKFAERHGLDTPLMSSRSFPDMEAWEADGAPEPEDAQIAACAPAEWPDSGSGDSRTGETLGGRLRALIAGPHPDVLVVKVSEAEVLAIIDEVERLEAQTACVRTLAREWARRGSLSERSPGYGSFARALLDVLDETDENEGA